MVQFYISTTDGSGNTSLLKQHTEWQKSWKLIIPGKFGGKRNCADLLFYNATAGDGEFYTIHANGHISLLKQHTGYWRKSWQLIIPGNFGGSGFTDLLFYDATTGEADFFTADGGGNISLLKKYTDWRKTWKFIIPGNFGGNGYTDLLFYDATTGEADIFTTDGSGNISLLKKYTDWRKTWKFIIPGNFGHSNYTDLLFYDATTGEAEFCRTDGSGNISLLKKHTDWRKSWQLIIPVNFDDGISPPHLLFYDSVDTDPTVDNNPQKNCIIDAVENFDNGKAYFFKGNQYIRYDLNEDKADAGYPKPIKEWKGLEPFADGIDTVFLYNRSVYFFKGNQYIRLDDDGTKVLEGYPKPIKEWKGLDTFADGIDAAVTWDEDIYFFKGNQYIRYDLKNGKALEASPLKLNDLGKGLDAFADGIDDAYESGSNIYFFKGDRYIRYKKIERQAALNSPKPIKGNWDLEGFTTRQLESPIK